MDEVSARPREYDQAANDAQGTAAYDAFGAYAKVGESNERAYAQALRVLSQAKEQALEDCEEDGKKRRMIVCVVAAIWLAITVVLFFVVGQNALSIGEIVLVAIVVFAIVYLLPTIRGRGNIARVFDGYESSLEALKAEGVQIPAVSDVRTLVELLGEHAVKDDKTAA